MGEGKNCAEGDLAEEHVLMVTVLGGKMSPKRSGPNP